MSRHLYIAGVDRRADLERGSLRIQQALTYQIDTCSFSVKGDPPVEGEEVIIEDDVLGRLFAGIVVKVELARTFPDKSIKVWNVECDDYTALLDRRLVVETYENMSASDIFLDIVAKYCPGFTTNGVRPGAPVIESTGAEFEYKRPSECFRWLCDYVGWHWQPDYYKDLHFFSAEELASPAPLILVPGGPFRFGKHTIDTQGLRNRVYVRGGTMLSDPQVVQWKADGVARIWTLPWGPHEVSFKVGEVLKTVGVENLHDEADFDYMMSFTEKYIRCSAQTPTPVEGITMALTARQDIPVITMVEDYASQAAIAKVQGGDGIYEHVISDDALISIAAAEAAGMADLREHGNPRVTGSFETEYAVPPVPVEKIVLDYAAKTKTDWEAGVLNGVEATDNGLVLESATAPTFTRTSVAYKQNGQQVAASQPRFEQGKFDKALLVEEGTTNIDSPDPSFESGVDGFTVTSGLVISSSTDWAFFGSKSLKMATDDTNPWASCYKSYGDRHGQTLTASVTFYDSIGGNNVKLVWYDATHDTLLADPPAYTLVAGVPYRASLTVNVPADCLNVRLYIYPAFGQSGTARTTYADGLLVEAKPYATSFIDGTRSPEILTIPTAGVLNPTEGTISLWVKPPKVISLAGNCLWATSGTQRFDLWWSWSSNDCISIVIGDITIHSNRPISSLQDGNFHAISVTWGSFGNKLYIDGVLDTSSAALVPSNLGSDFYIGSFKSFGYASNSIIDELRIDKIARTDEEIAASYASGQPLSVDEWTTYKLGFDGDLTVGKGGMMESSILTPALREGETTGSLVNWEDVVPAGADIKIKTSVSTDGGLTWNEWEEAEEDSPLPGITEGMDLAGLKLKFRAILITEDTSNSPRLSSLFLNIMTEVLEPRIWQPGQIVEIDLPDRGVEGEYLIQRVTITPTWSSPSIWTFRVDYGGRLLGIADFLKALVSAQQKKRVIEPTKNVQKYIYGEETLTVGDELITATRGLPFVCGDADAVCGLVVVSNG